MPATKATVGGNMVKVNAGTTSTGIAKPRLVDVICTNSLVAGHVVVLLDDDDEEEELVSLRSVDPPEDDIKCVCVCVLCSVRRCSNQKNGESCLQVVWTENLCLFVYKKDWT